MEVYFQRFSQTYRLPSVLFSQIFQFLNLSDRNSTQLVCKIWIDLCKLPIVQKVISKIPKSTGRLIKSFNTLTEPCGIAVWKNQIFVHCLQSLVIYNLNGNILQSFPVPHGGGASANSLGIDKNGLLYIPSYCENRIRVYTQNGRLAKYWNCPNPHSLTLTEDYVIVTATKQRVILCKIRFFTLEGKLVDKWKYDGNPHHLVVDKNELFVIDYSKHQVHVFSMDGKLLRQWEISGKLSSKLNFRSGGIAMSQDLVYVLNKENDSVKVFDRHGKFLFEVKSQNERLWKSLTVCNDCLFVTVSWSKTVQIFQLE